jgi:hypothetical protein
LPVFAGASVLRQRSPVLADDHHQIFGEPIGHLNRIHDTADRGVMPSQIVDFVGEIVLDRARHASIEKLRCRGAIEEAVEISGFVENLDQAVDSFLSRMRQ